MSDYEGQVCTCGCGLSAERAIRDAMSKGLNRDQAEADFDRAQAIRRRTSQDSETV